MHRVCAGLAVLAVALGSIAAAVPSAAAEGTVCDDTAYLAQSKERTPTTLFRYDLLRGVQEPIGTGDVEYNGIAHNPRDGLLYGIARRAGGQLAIVDPKTGHTTVREVAANSAGERLPTAEFPLGAVSPDGAHLYVYANAVRALHLIDISSDTARYVGAVPMGNAGDFGHFYDFAFHPRDQQLYGVATDGTILRVDPKSGVIARVGATGEGRTMYGAVFFDGVGNLYASSNASGTVWQADLTKVAAGMATLATVTKVGRGQPTPRNDGAGCLVARDYGDAPDTYKTFRGSDGPSHTSLTGLSLGADWDAERDADTLAALDGGNDDGPDQRDDEDALASGARLSGYSTDVALRNDTGHRATLAGWLDVNGDGRFDDGERAVRDVPAGATKVTLTWERPTGARAGRTYLRLRLFDGEAGNPKHTGAAIGGEVEDHAVELVGGTPTPTGTESSAPTTSMSATPTPSPGSGGVVPPADSPGHLPDTGANVGILFIGGFAALAAGALTLVLVRRRNREKTT